MDEEKKENRELIRVNIKNRGYREVKEGTFILEMLEDKDLVNDEIVAARIDGQVVDLSTPVYSDTDIELLPFDSPEGAEVYRHTASHVMAQAVKRLFDDVQLGIGPAIKDGFYYDFDVDDSLGPEEVEKVEEQMKQIVEEDLPLERKEITREEAEELFKEIGEHYKVELIAEIPEGEIITCYRQGEFIDLCNGPHLPSTGKLKAFKLLNVAGAYWRGDENRPMLQRVYGTAFPDEEKLQEHLQRLEEAQKRDHRKISKDMGLFSFHEEGPGFPFYLPKGLIIRRELEKFWREEHRKAGYQEIETPILLSRGLWEQSGHWEHYKDNMYFSVIDEQQYAVKPMNCPGAMLIFKEGMYSYRDLPLRIAEMGLVHRHEKSGTLHGLMRVRSFIQDDAHIFMQPEQIEQEVTGIIELIDKFYQVFGFTYYVELSTQPEDSMGSQELWNSATVALQSVLDKKGISYSINEGEGAFYGPKIDFHLEDCLNRTWQCGTIQLDFQMPEKFDLNYVGSDGEKHRPAIIHRVVYGALERFLALLIEHYGGAFPLWLAPVQVIIIPIADRHHDHAAHIRDAFNAEDIRVELDDRNEKLGYKIRQARLQKMPYMLIIGDKEVETGTVSVRHREQGDIGSFYLQDVLSDMKEEIEQKK